MSMMNWSASLFARSFAALRLGGFGPRDAEERPVGVVHRQKRVAMPAAV